MRLLLWPINDLNIITIVVVIFKLDTLAFDFALDSNLAALTLTLLAAKKLSRLFQIEFVDVAVFKRNRGRASGEKAN